MINPPFPYSVKIQREVVSSDPFQEAESGNTLVYEGECDYEVNRHPAYKNNVQVGKYKLYIPDNTVDIELNDTVEVLLHKRKVEGKIVDFFITNFGITIYWDNSNN